MGTEATFNLKRSGELIGSKFKTGLRRESAVREARKILGRMREGLPMGESALYTVSLNYRSAISSENFDMDISHALID